ncbi:MAG: TolC family protein [Candidatus Omnitrophota bacterium]|nr:TolC family protein [Candidatus Omnitrophota bacterium]
MVKGWNDYNVIGLTFSWPIFYGWLTSSKVEQAIIDLKQTQLIKEKTVKDIALELKTAYISLKNAVVKFKSVEADLILYKDNLNTAEEKYNQGQVSILDKNDAGLKYKTAIFNKNEVIYDYIIAKESFNKAQGGI